MNQPRIGLLGAGKARPHVAAGDVELVAISIPSARGRRNTAANMISRGCACVFTTKGGGRWLVRGRAERPGTAGTANRRIVAAIKPRCLQLCPFGGRPGVPGEGRAR